MNNVLTREEEKNIRVAMLKDIAGFCERNNIRYFLGFGTMLGAVRETGMIAWDYDIDVMMPRPDFIKFVGMYNDSDNFHNINYTIMEHSITPGLISRLAIVQDKTTINISDPDMDYRNPLKRINVEIYPIDGLPSSKIKRKLIINKVSYYSFLHKVTLADTSESRSAWKNFAIKLLKAILGRNEPFDIVDKMNSIMMKYPFEECEYCSVYTIGEPISSLVLHKTSMYEKYIYQKYEDGEYRIPKEYDLWLTQRYGDYMRPPENKEIARSEKLKEYYEYGYEINA